MCGNGSAGSLADRPVLSNVPAKAVVGTGITVTRSGGAAINAFSIIRSGSSTHTVNTDQRRIPLKFTPVGYDAVCGLRTGRAVYALSPTDSGVCCSVPPSGWRARGSCQATAHSARARVLRALRVAHLACSFILSDSSFRNTRR